MKVNLNKIEFDMNEFGALLLQDKQEGFRRIGEKFLNEALAFYPKPEIFNTDQGSQYTSKAHVEILKKHNIKISMDGKGRATDNICIERFWRSIKYELELSHTP